MSTTTPHLDHFVDALAVAFIRMTEPEQRLIAAGYRLLSEGDPVDTDALAQRAGWAHDEVEAGLRASPGAYLDGQGRLIGLWGMAVEEVSAHRARFSDRAEVWMWCALDPLFIGPLLGEAVTIASTCPTTGGEIRLSVEAGLVIHAEPASTVVSLLLPGAGFDAEVRQSFCHFVHFFVSPQAAEAWVGAHPGTFWITAPDGAETGRRLAAAAFPAVASGQSSGMS